MGLILSIIVLLFSLFSWISYSSRRSDSKQALQQIKEVGASSRQLTAEEVALLEPKLLNPQNAKPIALNNHDVFNISGEYGRHGIESNGNTTWHDTIADIEVILPYDANLFLEQFNEAEIVIADRFAVIVTLNGTFDLAGGQVRDEQRAQEDLYWKSGKRETFQNEIQSEEAGQQLTPEEAEIEAEIKRISHAEVLRQRSETTNEVVQRTPLSLGIGIATLFIMAFVLLAIAINLESLTYSLALTAAAGLVAIFALLMLLKRPKLPPAGKVNIVRGHLNHLNSDGLNHYLLGSKIAIEFPKHWIKFVEADKDVEMDLRTDDYSLVRMGNILSIDDEITNHPPVYWGRYLTLALVGFISFIAILFFTNSLRNDMLFSWSWLTEQKPVVVRSTDELKQYFPIVSGGRVEFIGSARCEIDTSRFNMPIDCLQIRWNGQTPSAPDRQLDPQILSIGSGEFMRPVANRALDKMLEMQRQLRSGSSNGYNGYGSGYGNYGSGYGRQPAIVTRTFSDISAMVNDLDSYCEQYQGDRSNGDVVTNNCNAFRSQFIRLLNDFSDEISVKNWAELKDLIENGTLPVNQVVALEQDTANLFKSSELMTRPVTNAFSNALAKDVAASQRGGAIVKIAQGSYSSMPTDIEFNQASTLRKIELYRNLASERSAFDIDIIGTVINSDTDANGTPVLVIDTSYNYNQPLPAEIQLSMLVLLSLWLSVWYGLRTVIGLIKADRRIAAIDREYAKRLGK